MGGAVADNHPIAGAAVGGAIAGGGRKLGPVVNAAVGAATSNGHPVAGEWIMPCVCCNLGHTGQDTDMIIDLV